MNDQPGSVPTVVRGARVTGCYQRLFDTFLHTNIQIEENKSNKCFKALNIYISQILCKGFSHEVERNEPESTKHDSQRSNRHVLHHVDRVRAKSKPSCSFTRLLFYLLLDSIRSELVCSGACWEARLPPLRLVIVQHAPAVNSPLNTPRKVSVAVVAAFTEFSHLSSQSSTEKKKNPPLLC